MAFAFHTGSKSRYSGQEEYERLRPLSYANANVILMAFALDSVDSLDNVLSKWNEEVREICGQNIPIILVGCKKDIRDAETDPDVLARAFVSTEQGERVSEVIGAKVCHCDSLLLGHHLISYLHQSDTWSAQQKQMTMWMRYSRWRPVKRC